MIRCDNSNFYYCLSQRKNYNSNISYDKTKLELRDENKASDQMRIDRVDHFHTVDSNPDFFIKFVDEGNRLETARACKRIMSSLLNIQQGQYLLDVGCGTGDDVRSLGVSIF